MRRVLIIGSSGAGKTTLASGLAKKTKLPLIHLDTEYWRPGWVPTPDDEWHSIVEDLVGRDSWIMEGNYSGTFHIRMPRADTIILLTRPGWLCLARAIWRSIKYFRRTRPDLAEGCPEQFDLKFYKWIWDFPNRSREKIEDAMASIGAQAHQIIITSDREGEAFLQSLD